MNVRTLRPGQLNQLLHGREIDYVAKNGTLLVVHCKDGSEVQVAWVDPNGKPFKGEPAIKFQGLNVHANTGAMGARSAARRETR